MTIQDLKDHPRIIQLCRLRHEESCKETNYERIFDENDVTKGWRCITPEGYYFWNKIETGDYSIFYEWYGTSEPKKLKQHGTEITSNINSIYFISSVIIIGY